MRKGNTTGLKSRNKMDKVSDLGECKDFNNSLRRKKQSKTGHSIYVLPTSKAKPVKAMFGS